MNRDPILIRVDGTPATGWEHFSRCLTLAAALQRRRRPTYFLSRLEPGFLGLNVKRGGNEWLEADNAIGTPEDLAETVQEIRRLNPAAVIIDAPEANESYLSALRATGAVLVALDNQASIRFPARLVINPLLGPGKDAYMHEGGTQLLLGPRFALVRSEVRRVRPLRAQEPPQPFRALIALGDDDPNRQSLELAKLLLGVTRVARTDVVARPYHPQLEELKALAEANPDRLGVAVEPAEVAARLARCHFALSAGNTWSLELA